MTLDPGPGPRSDLGVHRYSSVPRRNTQTVPVRGIVPPWGFDAFSAMGFFSPRRSLPRASRLMKCLRACE